MARWSRDFAAGRLKLPDLVTMASANGEPRQISGHQERYENLLNQYLLTR